MLLNADLGEGVAGEEQIVPYLHMASISCGAYAGDESSIRETLRLCTQHSVEVGAHPSYPDREHFGRVKMELSADQLFDTVREQLILFQQWALEEGNIVRYVKPHGALYNVSASDRATARVIAEAIRSIDPSWSLMGLAGSVSLEEAKAVGLRVFAEAFADRRYESDGRLCPRTDPRASIDEVDEVLEQVRVLCEEKRVRALSGEWVMVDADVVCVHGDGKQAVGFTRAVRQYLNTL